MLFKELILIKIFSLSFALVFGQNEDNLQFAIFGEPCQCVELSKCTNKTLATAPENEDCRKQQFNTICCDPSDIIQQQTNTAANNCVDNNGNCVASTVGINNNNNAKKCGQFYKKAFIERAGFEEEVEDGEFPWMIAVFDKSTGRLQCGASLIHPKVVITAAHCFKRNKENYLFRAALWNISADDELYEKQETEAQTIVIHPNFVQRNLFNDIAFVVLKKEFSLNRAVSLTCLPPPNQFYDDTNCFGTGWGKKPFVTGEEYHDTLKKLQLPVVGHRQCQTLLRNRFELGRKYLLHKSFLCAGGQRGRDMCLHDGGGPLVCLIPGQRDVYHQVGIVSWGLGCGLENVPGVYVDVSYFRNWIDAEMTKYNLEKSVYQF